MINRYLPILLFAGCDGVLHLPSVWEDDWDADGAPNHEDCAPERSDVRGDGDGDGWWDRDCEIKELPEWWFRDCDDTKAERNPGGPAQGEGWRPASDYETADMIPEGWEEGPAALAMFPNLCADGIPPYWTTDGLDNDCNNITDDPDFDGDGSNIPVDCNDCDFRINNNIEEYNKVDTCSILAYDGIDDDCSGSDLDDVDGDLFIASREFAESSCQDLLESRSSITVDGDDCDDHDKDVNPAAVERCDDVDQDCNGDPLSSETDQFEVTSGAVILHVDPAARPDGNGMPRTPFRSIGDAFDALDGCAGPGRPEVVIQLHSGIHEDTITASMADVASLRVLRIRAEPTTSWRGSGASVPVLTLALTDEQELYVEGSPDEQEPYGERLTFDGRGTATGLHIRGGRQVTMTHVVFIDHQETRALLVEGSQHLRLDKVYVEGPGEPVVGGGITADVDYVDIDALQVRYSSATGDGGCLNLIAADIELTEVELTDCHSDDRGGGALLMAEYIALEDVQIHHASSAGDGGGAYLVGGAGSELHATDLSLIGNLTEGGDGGGLWVRMDDATVDGSLFQQNEAVHGGAMDIRGSSAAVIRLHRSTFVENTAHDTGGAIRQLNGRLEVVDGVFSDGSTEQGGAIWGDGVEMDLGPVELSGNTATQTGGALWGDALGLQIHDALLSNNFAVSSGGAIYVSRSNTTIERSVMAENEAGDGSVCCPRGGALYATSGGSNYISETTFRGNEASSGGAIYAEPVALELVVVEGNHATINGGGVYVGDGVLFDRVTFRNNTAGEDGGGAYVGGGNAHIQYSSFEDNMADGDGGGAYVNEGDASVQNSFFRANRAGADGGGDDGGGLFAWNGTLHIERSLFEGNITPDAGGGVAAKHTNLMEIAYSEFLGNQAGGGGGIYLQGVSDIDTLTPGLHHLAFNGNEGTRGGTVYLKNVESVFEYFTIYDSGGGASLYVKFGASLTIRYGIFAEAAMALDGPNLTPPHECNLYATGAAYPSAPGTLLRATDAGFVQASPADGLWDDDLHLQTGSPARDAAGQNAHSCSGAVGELGAYGGDASGWTLPVGVP